MVPNSKYFHCKTAQQQLNFQNVLREIETGLGGWVEEQFKSETLWCHDALTSQICSWPAKDVSTQYSWAPFAVSKTHLIS